MQSCQTHMYGRQVGDSYPEVWTARRSYRPLAKSSQFGAGFCWCCRGLVRPVIVSCAWWIEACFLALWWPAWSLLQFIVSFKSLSSRILALSASNYKGSNPSHRSIPWSVPIRMFVWNRIIGIQNMKYSRCREERLILSCSYLNRRCYNGVLSRNL